MRGAEQSTNDEMMMKCEMGRDGEERKGDGDGERNTGGEGERGRGNGERDELWGCGDVGTRVGDSTGNGWTSRLETNFFRDFVLISAPAT